MIDVEALRAFLVARYAEERRRARTARARTEADVKQAIAVACERAVLVGDACTSGAVLGGEVLRLLAVPYAGHPGCDPEWVPRDGAAPKAALPILRTGLNRPAPG